MKPWMLTAPLAVVFMAGCSNDDGSGGNSTTGSFKGSYELEWNGCPTGKHQFSSNSQSETQRQVCTALQDDDLNNSCAENLRKDLFDIQCKGQIWTPQYGRKVSPSPSETEVGEETPERKSPPKPREETREQRQNREARLALAEAAIDEERSARAIEGINDETLKFLVEGANRCGFTSMAPAGCPSRQGIHQIVHLQDVLVAIDDSHAILADEWFFIDKSKAYSVIFVCNTAISPVRAEVARIYKRLQTVTYNDLVEEIKDPNFFELLVELQLTSKKKTE